jgi:hypothetical protein
MDYKPDEQGKFSLVVVYIILYMFLQSPAGQCGKPSMR